MMPTEYYALLREACERVKKLKNIDVSFYSIKFYGTLYHTDEKVYQVKLIINGEPITIYPEESAFKDGGEVPWSGLRRFRPTDFEHGPKDKKLMLTGCGAIYNYCKNVGDYRNVTPPPIMK